MPILGKENGKAKINNKKPKKQQAELTEDDIAAMNKRKAEQKALKEAAAKIQGKKK